MCQNTTLYSKHKPIQADLKLNDIKTYYDKTFLTQIWASERVQLTAGGMSVLGFDPLRF